MAQKVTQEDLSEEIEGKRICRTRTWAGLETKPVYRPQDASLDYEGDVGDPGQFPYTRGSFDSMYRGRLWSRRAMVGYGAPEDTNEGLKLAQKAGVTAINIQGDQMGSHCVDSDHPLVVNEVGITGVSVNCLQDQERLLDGFDLTKVDVAWHNVFPGCMTTYALCVALLKKQGKPVDQLLGSVMIDTLHCYLIGMSKFIPLDFAVRGAVDCIEYCARNTPRFSVSFPQCYDLRERGLTAVSEIAVGLAISAKYIEEAIKRGVNVDQFATRLAWVSSADMDFFEEIAKYRALRRMWAKMLRDRFGAKDPRSMRLRIAVHTAGSSLILQQPMNNIIRSTMETLAAVLGGAQSIETCTYDEPYCVPSHEARALAIRTQQILAHESGAARVADPLGGSYYIESLTNQIEEEATKLLGEIEKIGIVESMRRGIIEQWMDKANMQLKKEIDEKKRIIVGVNAFTTQEKTEVKIFEAAPESVKRHIERLRQMKVHRDQVKLKKAMRELYDGVKAGGNAMPLMVEAFLADATIGEVVGTARQAFGHSYDPYEMLSSPFGI